MIADPPRRPQAARAKLIGVLVGAAVVAVIALLALDGRGSPWDPGEPETVFELNTDSNGAWLIGSIFLDNDEQEAMTVHSVDVLTSPGIERVEVAAVLPNDQAEESPLLAGPGRPLEQVQGALPLVLGETFEPMDFLVPSDPDWPRNRFDLQLLVGFELADGAETGVVNGIRVTYDVGGRSTTRVFPHAAIACVPSHPCDIDDPSALLDDVTP